MNIPIHQVRYRGGAVYIIEHKLFSMISKSDLTNEDPDIVLGYLHSVDSRDIEDLEIFLREYLSRKVTTRENTTTLQAAHEWVLPALFIIYLSKSFIDSFLKELGSEAGKKFYGYLSSLVKRQKNNEALWMNTQDIKLLKDQLDQGVPEDKIEKSGNRSPVVSFNMSFSKSHKVNIVVPFCVTTLSENEIKEIIAEVPSIISTENKLGKYLHKTRVVIYGYDIEDKIWIEDPVRYTHKKDQK